MFKYLAAILAVVGSRGRSCVGREWSCDGCATSLQASCDAVGARASVQGSNNRKILQDQWQTSLATPRLVARSCKTSRKTSGDWMCDLKTGGAFVINCGTTFLDVARPI